MPALLALAVQKRDTGMRRYLAFLLLLALGCGMKEPAEERVKKSVASWEASLALVAHQWLAGRLRDHVARDAAKAAVEEIGKDAKSKVPAEVTHACARGIALAHQLEDAVEQQDRTAAARIERELSAASKELQR